MARTVFILGAGASSHAGAPLMAEFYRAITDLHEGTDLGEHKEDFELVTRGFRELDSVYAKVHMAYHENIENLLATFEMASILGHLGGFSQADLSRLPKAMKCVIAATIERRMLYRFVKGRGFLPHSGYLDFADCIKQMSPNHKPDIAILTFNYDYALEYAFHVAGIPLAYCLEDAGAAAIPYLKLHGSLNWGRCEDCGSIIPYSIERWASHAKTATVLDLGDHETPLYLSKHLGDLQHCGRTVPPDPFIVPPTWNKTRYSDSIAQVWQRAAKELASARAILLVGYSFPRTDEFFRHLIALSLAGGPLVDTFAIVNPNSEVYADLKRWVGDKLQGPLVHIPVKFENSKAKIWEVLQRR